VKFRVHFEYFPVTPGIASCIKFWYSPKPPHTRRDAEHLKRPYKKLLKKRTSKKLAKVQRTCRELASRAVYALLGWRERFGLGVHAARFHTNSLDVWNRCAHHRPSPQYMLAKQVTGEIRRRPHTVFSRNWNVEMLSRSKASSFGFCDARNV
jgi:hypothetical protein